MKHYQELSLKCSLYPKIKETLSLIKNLGCIQVCLSASQIDNLKQLKKYFDKIRISQVDELEFNQSLSAKELAEFIFN